jgi:hypothetical protein
MQSRLISTVHTENGDLPNFFASSYNVATSLCMFDKCKDIYTFMTSDVLLAINGLQYETKIKYKGQM